jgi:PAS domain S-box-containing protein
LWESEEKYRWLLNNMADVVTVMDMNLRFTFVSSSIMRMRGYTAEEAVAQTLEQVMTPESLQIVAKVLEEEMKLEASGTADPGRIRILEVEQYRKDGSIVLMENHLSFLRDETQKAVGIISLTSDISERRRAEEALRANKAQMSNALEMAHLGHWEYDVATDLFTFNDHFYKIFRTSVEQVGGYTMHSAEYSHRFVHPGDSDMVREETQKAIETTDPHFNRQVDHRILYADGTTGHITVRFFIVKDSHGRTVKTYGVNQDITDRKQAEEELREREERLQKQNDALLSLMSRGTLFQSNLHKAIAEITEVSAALIGTERVSVWLYNEDYSEISCIDLYSQRDHNHSSGDRLRSEDFPTYKASHQKGNVIAAMDVYTDPRTSDIPASYYKEHGICSLLDAPIWMSDRLGALLSFEHVGDQRVWTSEEARLATNMAALLSICFAESDRKRAEEEKAKLQGQLTQAQKMESVGRLAGGVAHDFNNMLAVILGHTELAMENLDPSQPLYRGLQEIRKAAEHSADLTRQLLAFARKQNIAPKVLDLNKTVEGMLKMLRRLIGEDIDLAWMPGANLWPVKVDPSQIDQILANLCVNARDAIKGVGKITIETQDTTLDEAYCAASAGFIPGEYVMLAVSDDGRGMDKETQSHLFEPFFTTKGVGEGTGLGLATVYGIVKQNNGFINFYSEPGHGTRFTIYLPRYAGKAGVNQTTVSAKPAECGHETILLVEDEPAILKMTALMLERLGYKVLSADRPGKAIRLAEEHTGRIDLLMTDVVMPEMNGRDLAGKILTFSPNLRCLFMSGYTTDVIARHGVLDENVHFIQKPFSIKDLATKVRETLDGE